MKIRSCIAEASEKFGIPVATILGPRGNREQSQARHAAYFLARSFGHSQPKIARVMGRDPSTIHHGARRALEWAKADPRYHDRLMGALRALWVRDVAWRPPADRQRPHQSRTSRAGRGEGRGGQPVNQREVIIGDCRPRPPDMPRRRIAPSEAVRE